MSINKLLFWGLTVCLFYSSCGVISKARYGNGYKLNLEWGKDEKPEYVQAKKAEKKQIKKNEIKEKESISEKTIVFENEMIFDTINFIKLDPKPESKLKIKTNKKNVVPLDKYRKNYDDNLPKEKHVQIANIFFYSSLLFFILMLHLGIPPIVPLLLISIAFVLAVIGLINILNNKGVYNGLANAIMIISTPLLFVLVYYFMIIPFLNYLLN